MQTPEEFVECIRAAEVVDGKYVKHFYTFNESLNLIRARDAEWQARVERLRAGLLTTTDRIEKLEAALKECVEYIQRTDKVNPMEALYRGEGYSKDALPLIDKICATLRREA